MKNPPTYLIGVSGFLLMLGIGAMYGLSALQIGLPFTAGTSTADSVIPFAAASLGLAAGTAVGERAQRLLGARKAAAAGAALWGMSFVPAGAFLAMGNLTGVACSFGVGGVGVGVAYLVIVPTVGAGFPARPLIGSAIGPLGFSTGTAIFALVAWATDLSAIRGVQAFTVCSLMGVGICAIAVLAMNGLPPTRTVQPTKESGSRTAEAKRGLSVLLFANASPGMLVFAIAVDLIQRSGQATTIPAEHFLALLVVFLFLGGLLAPNLRRRFGARATMVALLILRGVLLLAFSAASATGAALGIMIVVLFGHGAGFSLLPPLMRAQGAPENFTRNYGQVLIAWGLAGVTAAGTIWFSRLTTHSDGPALTVAGIIALLGAGWLFLPPAKRFMTVT